MYLIEIREVINNSTNHDLLFALDSIHYFITTLSDANEICNEAEKRYHIRFRYEMSIFPLD